MKIRWHHSIVVVFPHYQKLRLLYSETELGSRRILIRSFYHNFQISDRHLRQNTVDCLGGVALGNHNNLNVNRQTSCFFEAFGDSNTMNSNCSVLGCHSSASGNSNTANTNCSNSGCNNPVFGNSSKYDMTC